MNLVPPNNWIHPQIWIRAKPWDSHQTPQNMNKTIESLNSQQTQTLQIWSKSKPNHIIKHILRFLTKLATQSDSLYRILQQTRDKAENRIVDVSSNASYKSDTKAVKPLYCHPSWHFWWSSGLRFTTSAKTDSLTALWSDLLATNIYNHIHPFDKFIISM